MASWNLNLWMNSGTPAQSEGLLQNLRSIEFAAPPRLDYLVQVAAEISQPHCVRKLGTMAGKKSQRWNLGADVQGQAWASACWPMDGSISRSDWLRGIKSEMVSPSDAEESNGNPALTKGWWWCARSGAWMAPVLTIRSFTGKGMSELGFQPAALTLWQWDHDWISQEDRIPEIGAERLWAICSTMGQPALAAMRRALVGNYTALSWVVERIDAKLEKAEIGLACHICESEISARANRL